ncbi:dihydroxyacetone kinase family protein [Raineyella sp. LH-20]|uniref:dihydroxyacetone kinase family protein n=1 Tax=Raineyella sp. LH-20 TaxID=3081204 RepID=UPI002952ADC1|nr:dihydroxyacetone kinase family protein [Raineyella sp. LH-20]WOP19257.1 dihydroxyacetone kinase family protein [Raineyella sp. LH-20]
MTHIVKDPATFMEDMMVGFAAAHPAYVELVPGGCVRADEPRHGKVAVIPGGGSGHYPGFAGVVGPGMADGAVIGNIFTSPSAQDAYDVAKAAEVGGGVILCPGNYAGDVLNFTAAKERLDAEGIPTRTVWVTDDIASAPLSEIEKRRGIAGDFVVYKIAGAAAEEGLDLDAVEAVARRANAATRSFGVAFAGCTMPGADTPLFTVPAGRMGVGLGIHGEPGIAEDPTLPADELATMLVDALLADLPLERGQRITAVLNGLGATKYEELFVLWKYVHELLVATHGLVLVEPEVGEMVTSLDMAGCSLTLVRLEEDLERYWTAPCDTPAYRKGSVRSTGQHRRLVTTAHADAAAQVSGSPASVAAAATARRVLATMKATLVEAEEELGRIDAIAGDGDHGRGMVRGIAAAVDGAEELPVESAGVEAVLVAAGDSWASKAGGTSGVLWGATLAAVGRALGDSREEITRHDVARAVRAGLDAMQRLGKAQVGDKTIVDAFVPFAETLEAQVLDGVPLSAAWASAAAAATDAAEATAGLRPRLGRARPLAERSLGTPDAGATSFALCMGRIAPVLS